jgi:glycolate oxidase FAD binding subunit
VDLIEPDSREEVREALHDASERGTQVSIVGGRTHADKGDPCEVDSELATTGLDRVIAYDPAEMLAVVEAGMRVGELRRLLGERDQEWPSGASDGATVGGTIATAPSSPRRLRMGPLRDTVVEMELVTGDGRLVRSGARTVKSVAGFDVHRLATGSLGTLGAIVQVALKVRPLPKARRLVMTTEGGLRVGRTLLDAVPLPSSVVATPDRVEITLEGWPEELDEQTEAVRRAAGDVKVIEGEGVEGSEAVEAPTVVEVAVLPSRLEAVLDGETMWRALMGVGIAWVGLPDDGAHLVSLRRRVAALEVHRRLKAAFDPAGILAPGRFWGNL